MTDIGTPGHAPGALSRFVRRRLVNLYHRHGWQAVGAAPADRKAVIVAAPHTSNWDFPYFLGLTTDLGITPRFMAKESLFRWPMGGFMRDMGGIAVARNAGRNYVQAMVDEFARREDFLLVLAPEGTRSNAQHWRTGFYQIAMAAGVPIWFGFMDYARKVGGLGPRMVPTGDYAADMAPIAQFYAGVTPRFPDKQTQSIVAPDSADGSIG